MVCLGQRPAGLRQAVCVREARRWPTEVVHGQLQRLVLLRVRAEELQWVFMKYLSGVVHACTPGVAAADNVSTMRRYPWLIQNRLCEK